jgi:hypothetical protein
VIEMIRALLLLVLAPLASAQSFVETFTGGSNTGGWTWDSCDTLPSSGGNPGGYLRQNCLDTFACQPHTTDPSSVFCGDWRGRGVGHFGVDLTTDHTHFPFQRELHLILSDGSRSVFVGHGELDGVPQVTDGWKSLDFVIDAQSTTLPPGWEVLVGSGNDDADWNQVITSVSEVRLFYGYPLDFFVFDQWHTGLDNVRIGEELGGVYCHSTANSTGVEARLVASGSPAVDDDLLYLTAHRLPQHEFGYFVASQTQGFVQGPGGSQGDLCLGGQIVRFVQQVGSSGEEGLISIAIPLSTPPVLAGETWNFQGWFRDHNPGATSNFTEAVSVAFL